ncbi:MAG: DUF1778 domain-containing protein [Gammaproteobacteria bacterium]
MKPAIKKSPEIRVQFRTTEEEKLFFEMTARRCGFKNLSEFLRVSAYEKARREFPEQESPIFEARQLSAQASKVVANAIINPPEANENLQALFSSKKK